MVSETVHVHLFDCLNHLEEDFGEWHLVGDALSVKVLLNWGVLSDLRESIVDADQFCLLMHFWEAQVQHVLLFSCILSFYLLLEYRGHDLIAFACLGLVQVNDTEGSPSKLLFELQELIIDKDMLNFSHLNKRICSSGRSPELLLFVDLTKPGCLSHILHLDARDQPAEFIPVSVLDAHKIFFECRGVNDPAVPGVQMGVVPIIKAVHGLILMLEVRHDKALVEDLHLLLVNDTVARREKLLNAFHLW